VLDYITPDAPAGVVRILRRLDVEQEAGQRYLSVPLVTGDRLAKSMNLVQSCSYQIL
jgi:hypothetical protein